MANIYPEQNQDRPEKKTDAQTPEKTVGVYDRPKRKGPSKGLIIAIVLIIIIVAWVLLAGFTAEASSSALWSGTTGYPEAVVSPVT